MKKHIIFISALLMTSFALSGCSDTKDKPSEQESSSSEIVETTTQELIEIDPFEGVDPSAYYHKKDGTIDEKSNIVCFHSPEPYRFDDKIKDVQFVSYGIADGLKQCARYGCSLNIYREVIDKNIQEGDTYKLHLKLENENIPEDEIPAFVEERYGIRLTQTTKFIKVHFEEEPIEDLDPFEEANVYFQKNDNHFYVRDNLINCTGCKNAADNNVELSYELSVVEGNGLNDIYAGDKIKYSVVLKENGKEYKGDDINKQLDKGWSRIHLTQTEKEYYVFPTSPTSNRYSANVNVMFNRPDNWYEIVSNKNRFNKYDLRHIDGSTATIPITAELTRQFCGVDDENMEFFIDHNTTGKAYENLILKKDQKDIILVTEPSEEELQMAADNNVELDVTPIALDGFVFITHKDNPVDSLTVEQIQDIYSGYITNWAEVGGYDEEIIAYQREPNSGSQTVMENMVMNGIEMMYAPTEKIAMTMGGLVDHIASYSNSTASIGYSFYYYLNNLYKNEDIKVINIDGVSPSNENLLDGSYPFSSGYFAVTLKGGNAKAEEIKNYLLSDEGQDIIRLAGYCPVG